MFRPSHSISVMSETLVRCQSGRLSWGRDCQAGDKAGGGRNAHTPASLGRPCLHALLPLLHLHLHLPCTSPAPAPRAAPRCTARGSHAPWTRQAGRSRPHFFPSIEGGRGAFQFLLHLRHPGKNTEVTMRAGMRRQAPRHHRMLQVKMPGVPSFTHPALQESPDSLLVRAAPVNGLAGPGLTRPARAGPDDQDELRPCSFLLNLAWPRTRSAEARIVLHVLHSQRHGRGWCRIRHDSN
ncbi:hypothetical protein F5X68DRAFT_42766 [Plectosphaerella plurivora]|uniref:Uncharacterized protein n=1 Tax=Plectosphaerella plurivora TaxID=936078 RepID=A0A9P8V1H7_9PEZI|nr:hypothetical protein F5X68DRAFT_42766 [Plectosphaerella plurivora]